MLRGAGCGAGLQDKAQATFNDFNNKMYRLRSDVSNGLCALLHFRPQIPLLCFTMRLNQVTVPALDVEASIEFYRGIGLRLIVKALPHYARFETPEGESTFSLHKVSSVAQETGLVIYFECADLDAKAQQLQEQGYAFDQPPKDEQWLWREARLRDPSNNVVCLYWAGDNRRFPPWRVQE
jgi:predicted enzyme related to lactoylglutathione lyase